MFTRAVHRRQDLRHVVRAAEQIQLPWLCPALWSSHTTYSRSNHRPIARSKTARCPRTAQLSTNSRKLAAASTLPDILDPAFPYSSSSQPPPNPYKIQPLAPDISNMLMIDTTTAAGPEVLEFDRRHKFITGNAWELEATLEACLQIHRWDRAMAVLGQLRVVLKNDHSQLQRLYNKVLEAMVFDHIWNRTTDNLSKINTWVEAVLGKADIKPNAQTFALKIKAAMATLQGPKRDRTVRRYWDMAKEHNVDWEVASLREILSDSDLGKLSEISPLELGSEEQDFDTEDSAITAQEDIISQPAVPQVRETNQKGLGMWALKKSLSLFGDASHLAEWSSVKDADPASREAYSKRRQMQLENDSLTSATERWRIEHEKRMKMGISGHSSHGHLGALIWQWHQELTTKIEADLQKVEQAELQPKRSEQDRLRCEYGPFLRLLTPQHMAALTTTSVIQVLTKAGTNNRMRLVRLVTDIGRTVEEEVNTELKRQHTKLKDRVRQAKGSSDLQSMAARSEILTSSPPQRQKWSIAQRAKLGSVLCEMLFDSAKLKVTQESDGTKISMYQPAFSRQSAFRSGKSLTVVTMNQEMAKLLTREPVADVIAKQLPMVCEPAKWTGFESGGYLDSRNPAVRIKYTDHTQEEYGKAAAQRGDLDQMFAALDVLGTTGWRINKNVFKVMVEAWNSGEGVANLPPLEKVFPDIPEPSSEATARERYEHYRVLQDRKNEENGIHSNRCFQNFQLEIARAFRDETFYLPHNVDFRGRAYPIPPYLNQMGADNARALIIFDKGRPLGAQGLGWLKVHLANVCGYDKASLTDRANFADNHMDDIRDSVQNPLSGGRWWLTAEDPWQCLATCHELVQAIDSGNPETFVSHLPIHQDGTCNGLQHYAALGGDIAGARQVNLEPGDKPADVYTGVAELVKADIKRDAEAGDELAKMLEGRITRKIVKQTVMTNVYGVTFSGAIRQVRKQVDAAYPDFSGKKIAGQASTYIARKIFKGLGKLFEGAHDIQYWFGDCATRITNSISTAQLEEVENYELEKTQKKPSKRDQRLKKNDIPLYLRQAIDQSDFRSTIVWTTPLKLPVVQPYRVTRAQMIKTHMAHIVLSEPSVTDSVDKKKQLQAFPPNFIHSLDATHMMLSALEAQAQGLSFSAVHDSFWTHAADIDKLNSLLRDAFIRMHSEDIIGRLRAEFETRYKGHIYLAKVGANNMLAKKLAEYRENTKEIDHDTTSSKPGKRGHAERRRQFWELMQEHKRQQLLNSPDPKDQQKGRKMVTAASIYEDFNGEKYLANRSSLGETALGHVPESQSAPEAGALEEALTHDEVDEIHDVDLEATLEPLVNEEALSSASESAIVGPSPASSLQHGKNFGYPDSIFPASYKPKGAKPGRKKGVTIKDAQNTRSSSTTWVWLPLTFKEIPKKGEWDVRRLKESTYFFS